MRNHFTFEWRLLCVGSFFFLLNRIARKMSARARKIFEKRDLSHVYMTALFVSAEEDIHAGILGVKFQFLVEKKHAVCWISSVQNNDVRRGDAMNRDSSRIVLALSGIIQKKDIYKGTAHFHTTHFRRWYDYGRSNEVKKKQRDFFSIGTSPLSAIKTDRLTALPDGYDSELDAVYAQYEKTFHKSPLVQTEKDALYLCLDVACKTGTGECIAQCSFTQQGEPRAYHVLLDRFAEQVVEWLLSLHSQALFINTTSESISPR